jgi:hypothetical protein
MLWSSTLNALSATLGLSSALFLAAGAASISTDKIIAISDSGFDGNIDFAEALAAQKADYQAGLAVLALAFATQLGAVAVSATAHSPFRSTTEVIVHAVAAALVVSGISWVVRGRLKEVVFRRIRERDMEMRNKHNAESHKWSAHGSANSSQEESGNS